MIIETFELPTHWATALMYGEIDGYEEEDIQAMDSFEKYMIEKYGSCRCIEIDFDHRLQRYHDATDFGILACDVSTFTFDVTVDERDIQAPHETDLWHDTSKELA